MQVSHPLKLVESLANQLTVSSDQGEEGLGSLLNSLVESLGRGVSVGTENLVLSKEHSLYNQ